MIPKLLHLFWQAPEGEDRALPVDMKRHVDEWQRLHPEFDLQIWSRENLRDLLIGISELPVWESFQACRFEAMKSDVARAVLIYKLGGFYTDLKNLPLRRFLDILAETDTALITEHPPTVEDYVGRPSNAFLGAPPQHEFFHSFLSLICKNIEERQSGGVVAVTGNAALKRNVQRFSKSGRDGDLTIIPSVQAWGAKGGAGGWMQRTSASYNKSNMSAHWSVRQKTESLYVD